MGGWNVDKEQIFAEESWVNSAGHNSGMQMIENMKHEEKSFLRFASL